jgi:hypothetical protein
MDRHMGELPTVTGSTRGNHFSPVFSLCGIDDHGLCDGGISFSLLYGQGFPAMATDIADPRDDSILDKFFGANLCLGADLPG